MKKVVLLFVALVISFGMGSVPIFADEVPTAKVSATLVGDSVPQSGEKFTIAIDVNEISTGLFVSGEVIFNWPAEVVSLADSYYDETVIVTNDYCLGNVYNQKIGRTGKFEYISNFDKASLGRAAVAIYISLSASDQAADVVSDLTMFEISFVINEGYTYDDFYLEITDSVLFLTADKSVVSKYEDGDIVLESIGEAKTTSEVATGEYSLLNLLRATNSNTESDINTNINIIYNNEYYEAILLNGNTLEVGMSIENSSANEKNLECYLAEYNSDNCLLKMTAMTDITVPAEEIKRVTLSKEITDSATVLAKIFLWEKGSLAPVVDNIKLIATVEDYYSDTFNNAGLIESDMQICGVVNVDTDADILMFKSPLSGTYMFKLSTNDVIVELYDSEENCLSTTATNGNYVMYTLLEGDTYYMEITGSENDSYIINPHSVNISEKNEGFSESLQSTFDYDLYEFTPNVQGEYIITAVGTNGVKATLYNANFEIVSSSQTGDSDVSFRITWDLTANERYYIIVEQKENAMEATEYSLYVEEPFEIVGIY